MAKMNLSKVEKALEDSVLQLSIQHINELGVLANAINDPKTFASKKIIGDVLTAFQNELKKTKEKDPKLYKKLDVSEEMEQRFFKTADQMTAEDWTLLKDFKIKIDNIKKELIGSIPPTPEDEKQIEQEIIRHINKRFNVREGWLPLK